MAVRLIRIHGKANWTCRARLLLSERLTESVGLALSPNVRLKGDFCDVKMGQNCNDKAIVQRTKGGPVMRATTWAGRC